MSRLYLRVVAGLAISAAVLCGTAASARPSGEIAHVQQGALRGTLHEGFRTFLGIPYAAAPVGDKRWQPPEPPPAWRGVRDATRPGAQCAQASALPGAVPSEAEDCLFLNVFAPTRPAASHARPVMVWIHGGGFVGGAGDPFDARRLATQGDVVVVTINHRLGIFGFFGHPALPDGGAFGFQDQVAALKWVKRNAAAFGGDPNNVTVFGESAGGMSACALLTSPAAKGLIQRAIVQSGPCFLRWPKNSWFPSERSATPYVPSSETQARGRDVAAKLGCDDSATALDCLRRRTPGELLKWTMLFGQITYGGPVLPTDPAKAVRSGQVLDIPVMIGTTHDEHRSMAAGREREAPVTPERYVTFLKASFDGRADAIAAAYPASEFAKPVLAWSAVGTDAAWACPMLNTARALAAHVPTYTYEFAEPTPPNPGFRLPPGVPIGSAHATELAFLFDFPPKPSELTTAQAKLGDEMIGYWSRFAATGDPNGAGAPRWPRFSATAVEVMQLRSDGEGVRLSDGWRDHRCDFWATVPVEP